MKLGLAFVLTMGLLGAVASDYAAFAYREQRGTALGAVTVRQYISTPLKNGRNELDYLGEFDQPCVRAMVPHWQIAPCWWVRRHKDHWTRS